MITRMQDVPTHVVFTTPFVDGLGAPFNIFLSEDTQHLIYWGKKDWLFSKAGLLMQ